MLRDINTHKYSMTFNKFCKRFYNKTVIKSIESLRERIKMNY